MRHPDTPDSDSGVALKGRRVWKAKRGRLDPISARALGQAPPRPHAYFDFLGCFSRDDLPRKWVSYLPTDKCLPNEASATTSWEEYPSLHHSLLYASAVNGSLRCCHHYRLFPYIRNWWSDLLYDWALPIAADTRQYSPMPIRTTHRYWGALVGYEVLQETISSLLPHCPCDIKLYDDEYGFCRIAHSYDRFGARSSSMKEQSLESGEHKAELLSWLCTSVLFSHSCVSSNVHEWIWQSLDSLEVRRMTQRGSTSSGSPSHWPTHHKCSCSRYLHVLLISFFLVWSDDDWTGGLTNDLRANQELGPAKSQHLHICAFKIFGKCEPFYGCFKSLLLWYF